MITNEIPVIRAEFGEAIKATPHLQEGRFAKLDSSGKLVLATSADEALGVICNPDSQSVADLGQATTGELCLRSFGGIVEVQVGTLGSSVAAGQKLSVASDGRATDAAGTPVAVSVDAVTSTEAGQLVRCVLMPFTADTAPSEEESGSEETAD